MGDEVVGGGPEVVGPSRTSPVVDGYVRWCEPCGTEVDAEVAYDGGVRVSVCCCCGTEVVG